VDLGVEINSLDHQFKFFVPGLGRPASFFVPFRISPFAANNDGPLFRHFSVLAKSPLLPVLLVSFPGYGVHRSSAKAPVLFRLQNFEGPPPPPPTKRNTAHNPPSTLPGDNPFAPLLTLRLPVVAGTP